MLQTGENKIRLLIHRRVGLHMMQLVEVNLSENKKKKIMVMNKMLTFSTKQPSLLKITKVVPAVILTVKTNTTTKKELVNLITEENKFDRNIIIKFK